MFTQNNMNKISDDSDYNKAIAKIDSLMAKGSKGVSTEELEKIHALAVSVQTYEQAKYAIELPGN
jgi:HTH-type transcriptional regulator/antitoxin HigA